MTDQWQTRATLLYKLKQDHDEKAWEEFAAYYSSYIKMVLIRIGVSQQNIDDMLQTVMLETWKALPKYEYRKGEVKFRTWFSTLIRNKTFSWMKKEITHQSRNTSSTYEDLDHSQGPEIEEIVETEWKRYITDLAWKHIQDHFSAEVLDVFASAMKGATNQKIAAETGLKENTVAVYKKRVKQALHNEILRLEYELN